jgi:Tfp pilus tip-associated adhesin PilY1
MALYRNQAETLVGVCTRYAVMPDAEIKELDERYAPNRERQFYVAGTFGGARVNLVGLRQAAEILFGFLFNEDELTTRAG